MMPNCYSATGIIYRMQPKKTITFKCTINSMDVTRLIDTSWSPAAFTYDVNMAAFREMGWHSNRLICSSTALCAVARLLYTGAVRPQTLPFIQAGDRAFLKNTN